jgi:hypothetical protein
MHAGTTLRYKFITHSAAKRRVTIATQSSYRLRQPQAENDMTPQPPKKSILFQALMVLFTIFGIPLIIALPFLLSGFIGG